ncbi:MAG TPA: 50S ribosomal protein L6 [Gammaproteobacteria bacterium]|nr:50S ribosomal protein L6 [Gammaproteobacteria bacterium]
MSRLAKYPIPCPSELTCTQDGMNFTMKSSDASMTLKIHPSVTVKVEDNKGAISIQCSHVSGKDTRFLGTMASLIKNMIKGLTKGYSTVLEIHGVGYRFKLQGKTLVVNAGKSHEELYVIHDNVKANLLPSQTELELKSYDKQRLGQVAAEIIAFRKPDAYKGKGVRKRGVQLKLKEVKKK